MRPIPLVISRPSASADPVFSDSPSRSVPWALRLRVLFNSRRLDRELAEGQVPEATAERALRAEQLTAADRCGQLACSLREVVADAEHPGPAAVSSALPARRDVVLANRQPLFGIAAKLERASLADVCGVARARAILCDGAGPLYSRYADRSMSSALAWVEEGFRQ
jgi:hypothetical protein